MEVFSRMMQKADQAGFIEGFSTGTSNQNFSISHLLFADDSIIFCGADPLQLGHLRCTLLGFEAVSGLKINLSKSEILPVGHCSDLDNLAAVLGCKIGSLPTVYLGMPLGANLKSKQIWEPVMERCRSRLAEWQLNYLSTGARVTLIKSVLSSLPTYFFSLFSAPVSVLKELERMQRNFLWGRNEGAFKHNLVNWEVVCKPIQSGGVGIRQLKLHNEALMAKWLWRFAHEDSSLWKRMIVVKYGEEKGGWSPNKSSNSFGLSLWNNIRRKWSKFDSCLSWKVGKGDRVLFWKYKWLEIGILSEVFSAIYAIAADKNALVSDYSTRSGSNRVWNVQLRRNMNDWELDSFWQLLDLLYSLQMEDSADAMIWKQSKNKVFTVKSFYLFLQGGEKEIFPWMKLWKSSVPTRVIFFSWCAAKGRILTIDNLKLRGYSMVNRCSLCLCHEESIDHLLIHCAWSTDLWRLILSCFGVQMCFPENLKSFLLAWWGQPMGRRKKKIWNLVPFCIFWLIWKERNRRIFDNIDRTALHAKSLFLSCLYSWVEEGKDINLCSFLQFIANMQ